jgi:hypothetical protein
VRPNLKITVTQNMVRSIMVTTSKKAETLTLFLLIPVPKKLQLYVILALLDISEVDVVFSMMESTPRTLVPGSLANPKKVKTIAISCVVNVK